MLATFVPCQTPAPTVPTVVILGCAAVDKTPVIDSKEPNNPVIVPLALILPEAVIWDKVFINLNCCLGFLKISLNLHQPKLLILVILYF